MRYFYDNYFIVKSVKSVLKTIDTEEKIKSLISSKELNDGFGICLYLDQQTRNPKSSYVFCVMAKHWDKFSNTHIFPIHDKSSCGTPEEQFNICYQWSSRQLELRLELINFVINNGVYNGE